MGDPVGISPEQGKQLSWLFKVLRLDLTPLGLGGGQTGATVQPLPPDEVLKRAGDGAVFWQPNPAPATWGTGSTPTPAGWIEAFLRSYDLAPAAAGAPATECVFNQAATTVASVADLAAAQAALAGYRVAPAAAQTAAQGILAERRAGRDAGAQIAKHEPDANDLAMLRKLSTPALLDALEAARAGGRLEALAKQGTDRRVAAASLAVLHHLGAKWQGLMSGLPEADQQPIRQHVYGRMLAGDVGDMTPLAKNGGGGSFAAPDTASDEDWVKGFLQFYGIGPDPLGDGSGSTCLFNSRTETLTDLLDIVAEQAAHAGRLVGRDLARKIVVPMLSPHVPSPPGSNHRFSYYLSYGFLPITWHKDIKSGADTHDPVAEQVGLQVTLELHPDNESGPELSLVAQVTGFDDPNGPFKVQNYLGGFQAAYVFSLFDGMLQLQPLVQALAGASRAQQAKDGSIKLVSTGQILAGGQVVFGFEGLGKYLKISMPDALKHLQVGVQSGGSVTDPSGAGTTGDVPIQFFVQGKL